MALFSCNARFKIPDQSESAFCFLESARSPRDRPSKSAFLVPLTRCKLLASLLTNATQMPPMPIMADGDLPGHCYLGMVWNVSVTSNTPRGDDCCLMLHGHGIMNSLRTNLLHSDSIVCGPLFRAPDQHSPYCQYALSPRL